MTGVVFLDFDGVLHPVHSHEAKHFCQRAVFEDAVRRIGDVEIVISSTWRLHETLEELKGHFSPEIAKKVIDTTPQFRSLSEIPEGLVAFEREAECRSWLKKNRQPWQCWLAVDDRNWLFQPFCSSLLAVNPQTGFSHLDGLELSERLSTSN